MATRATNDREGRLQGARAPSPHLHALQARLTAWEALAYGDALAAHHRGELTRYLTGLRELTSAEPDRRSAALLALLALDHGIRGGRVVDTVVALLDVAATTDHDAVELAIAWGCGWGRATPGDGTRGTSVAALLALSGLARSSIERTLRWLADTVPGLGPVLHAGGVDEYRRRVVSYAHHVAVELSLALPAGRPARHALGTWRPDACRLPAFVATAVRGTARLPVRAGAFASSLLSVLLREDHLLLVGPAEFGVCSRCHPEAVERSQQQGRIDLGSVRHGLHDLARCPRCGAPADPAHTYRVARKHWLIVPADWGGSYEAADRRRCSGCGNLFPAARARCPLCRRPAPDGRRVTSIWVR